MDKLNPERVVKFIELAAERQRIYCYKTLGFARPYTQDKQFDTWFFCNVFRDQDKVTKWIVENVCKPYADMDNLWRKVILARRLSRISSLEAVQKAGGFADISKAKPILKYLVAVGEPIITNAFVMGIPDPSLGDNKVDYMFNLIEFYWQEGILPDALKTNSVEKVTRALMKAPNMGGFLSYEVATDFTYTRYLRNATDLKTWANPGPGCVRGLNVLCNGHEDIGIDKRNTLPIMRELLARWQEYCTQDKVDQWVQSVKSTQEKGKGFWLSGFPALFVRDSFSRFLSLSMREVEHWLCEFDKHERTRDNKRRY